MAKNTENNKNKNIVLCSDGTGNKGGYGNDSNVYKLYRAIDIHNPTKEQISFYDNGVGTKEDGSAVKDNKIWVALSGALGLGFQDKVRDLYEFLARHYQAGDKIYIFGFSRGAATVRAFTGFINCCGLIDKSKTDSEKEFQKLINKALLAYQKCTSNPQLALDFKKDYAVTGGEYAPNANLQIHFLGVWDTVSALGFPDGKWKTSDWFFDSLDLLSKALKEITNKTKWPHQFYNYDLNEHILYACQALAIDDERKTFHPKAWDESKREADSVEQVWFAGTHSNVGGGYPRSGLSDVALEWIFKKAAGKDLIFIKDDSDAVEVHANVQGKLYDSRDGFAVYYRYEPRYIEQLCIGDTPEQPKIAIGKIKIHNTVVERIKRGTALYAPGFLPAQFDIVKTNSDETRSVSIEHKQCCDCRDEVNQWVDKWQWLYRTFVEITLVMLISVLYLWVWPPGPVKDFILLESTQSLSACGAFNQLLEPCLPESFHWYLFQSPIYDLFVYIFPAIFKNFIIFVICIYPLLLFPMLYTLYWLYRRNNDYKKEQSIAFAKTRLLLLETLKKHDV